VKKICAWCLRELVTGSEEGGSRGPISHGICHECAARLNSEPRSSVGAFLGKLNEAVFLVGAGGRIVSANSAARAVVGKELAAIEDRLSGDVFDCENADLPGGCGKTQHCKACAIRNSVEETLATGMAVERVPAYQGIKTADGVRQKRFFISTERVGDSVMLRIDEVA
jgi:PAS domain-containing protein